MPRARPAYPDSFRREALESVRQCQGRSIPDVAESLGVSPRTLRRRQGVRDSGKSDEARDGLLCAGDWDPVIGYRGISEAKKAKGLSVSLQRELLGVSESGYGARAHPRDPRGWQEPLCGPRVHAMLRREGIRVGEKRVARRMRAAGLRGRLPVPPQGLRRPGGGHRAVYLVAVQDPPWSE